MADKPRAGYGGGESLMKPCFAYPRVCMPVDFEVKVKIDEPEVVVAALHQRGATLLGNYRETNTFFDTDDRELLASDEGLRLRVQEDLNRGKIECALTHKGPSRSGHLRSREETKLIVDSPSEATMLLERLGFARCLSFEKRRQSWLLDGCSIQIEQLPHLGHFVEIRGAAETMVTKVREALGLADRPLIKSSYVAMLTSYVQERGYVINDITFPRESAPRMARAG